MARLNILPLFLAAFAAVEAKPFTPPSGVTSWNYPYTTSTTIRPQTTSCPPQTTTVTSFLSPTCTFRPYTCPSGTVVTTKVTVTITVTEPVKAGVCSSDAGSEEIPIPTPVEMEQPVITPPTPTSEEVTFVKATPPHTRFGTLCPHYCATTILFALPIPCTEPTICTKPTPVTKYCDWCPGKDEIKCTSTKTVFSSWGCPTATPCAKVQTVECGWKEKPRAYTYTIG